MIKPRYILCDPKMNGRSVQLCIRTLCVKDKSEKATEFPTISVDMLTLPTYTIDRHTRL